MAFADLDDNIDLACGHIPHDNQTLSSAVNSFSKSFSRMKIDSFHELVNKKAQRVTTLMRHYIEGHKKKFENPVGGALISQLSTRDSWLKNISKVLSLLQITQKTLKPFMNWMMMIKLWQHGFTRSGLVSCCGSEKAGRTGGAYGCYGCA